MSLRSSLSQWGGPPRELARSFSSTARRAWARRSCSERRAPTPRRLAFVCLPPRAERWSATWVGGWRAQCSAARSTPAGATGAERRGWPFPSSARGGPQRRCRWGGCFTACIGFAQLADERALLVVVDDAQWVDAPSLRWLAYLAPRVGALHAVVALAVRTGETAAINELL